MLGRFIWDELLRPIFWDYDKEHRPRSDAAEYNVCLGLHFLLIEISIPNKIKLD